MSLEDSRKAINTSILEAFSHIRPGGSLEETLMDRLFPFGLCDGCDRSRHLDKKTRLCTDCQFKKENPKYHFGLCKKCSNKDLYPINRRLTAEGFCLAYCAQDDQGKYQI